MAESVEVVGRSSVGYLLALVVSEVKIVQCSAHDILYGDIKLCGKSRLRISVRVLTLVYRPM
jgi:hypothetical protein